MLYLLLRTASTYTTCWSLLILINKHLLTLLPPVHPTRYGLDAECRALALELCATWENAWTHRPIGAWHMWFGLVVAYEWCAEDVQGWILGGLNWLLEEVGCAGWRWSGELVEAMGRKLMGEGDWMGSG
ncbi:hypothetical protein BU23DRAFT_599018 [Bimuria novae-zelandiae CBS 107.79]|uniref:Uncharacterized protein n=1 Tax=Bimuria novae-zelandiae CBS 107.79 TaxID=1447943 RepID=A0A6A5V8Y8_9PLEO|nr:hypothetical protein BU23DRAFT_599018 [Bimuria novae-zelandiae CBS 107.79]